MTKSLSVCGALALLVVASACQKSSPTTPSEIGTTAQTLPDAALRTAHDFATGITLTAPQPVTPTNNQQFKNTDQPLTLTVKNGVSTGSTALTYTFEVATDAAFAGLVYSKGGVAEGSGQTSMKIDTIGADKSYFWRARVSSGTFAGPNSPTRGFTIGPAVTLQTPVAASPTQGSSAGGSSITLTVTNVGRSGPVGTISYRFELSDSASFGNLLLSSTVAEQSSGQTSVTTSSALQGGTYFWRVTASDPASGVTSPTSAVVSFTYQPFSMSQATIVSSPFDLATWGETSRVTSVQFTGDAFLVDFDKRDGPGRWPDTPFGSGSIEYTLGLCGNINNHWYCSAVVQFWYGRDLGASSQPWNVATAWFYDPARWGPMTGWQPADNETVGVFACAGNCRNNVAGDNSYVKERTNVAFVSWQNNNPALFTFANGAIKLHSAIKR